MKATELRIGNWVSYFGNNYVVAELKNDCNTQILIGCKKNTYELISVYNTLEAFDAIPITEDWLVKFGFEKLDCGDLYYELQNHCGILKDNDGICLVEDFCHEGIKVNCGHVHQLQNLYFALTGKELTSDSNTDNDR